jgi:hypothetical protein
MRRTEGLDAEEERVSHLWSNMEESAAGGIKKLPGTQGQGST